MSRKPFVLTNARHMQATRQIDKPEPGLFRMKLVKGGVSVAARIIYGPTLDPWTGEPLDRSFLYCGEINGELDPDPSPTPSARVARIWESGERISQAEYEFLLADRAWAAEHAPHLPEANPRRAVDLRSIDPASLF